MDVLERSSTHILQTVDRFIRYYDMMREYADRGAIKSSLDRGSFVRPQDLLPPDIIELLGVRGDSHAHAYGPEAGDKKLIQHLVSYENLRHNTSYASENVAIVPGAWAGVQLVLEEIFRVGQPNRDLARNLLAVVGPTHYQLFHRAINVSNIDVRGFDFVIDGKHHCPQTMTDLDQIFEAGPRALFITNPNNPNGLYIRGSLMREIVERCKLSGMYLVIDEINNFLPLPGESELVYGPWIQDRHVIRIDSFSKKRALAEYRVGWVIADEHVLGDRTTRLIGRLSGFMGNAPRAANTAIVKLLQMDIDALNGVNSATSLYWPELSRKREYVLERMRAIPSITCLPMHACINVCIQFPKSVGTTDLAIAKQAMEYGMLLMPAGGYGHEPESRIMRVTVAERWEKLDHGLDALALLAAGN